MVFSTRNFALIFTSLFCISACGRTPPSGFKIYDTNDGSITTIKEGKITKKINGKIVTDFNSVNVKNIIVSKIDNGNGTVTDTKTGLMWKKCSEGLVGSSCSGKASKYNWNDSMRRYTSSSFAGYNDWRLPSVKELHTLTYCVNGTSRKDAFRRGCYKNFMGRKDGKLAIQNDVFPNIVDDFYWTYEDRSPRYAQVFSFYSGDGHSYGYDKNTMMFPVLLVRGKKAAPVVRVKKATPIARSRQAPRDSSLRKEKRRLSLDKDYFDNDHKKVFTDDELFATTEDLSSKKRGRSNNRKREPTNIDIYDLNGQLNSGVNVIAVVANEMIKSGKSTADVSMFIKRKCKKQVRTLLYINRGKFNEISVNKQCIGIVNKKIY